MVVQKFGGTSVADPEAIRRLIEIVRAARSRDGRGPVVVVSAMSEVTDALLGIASTAGAGRPGDALPLTDALLRASSGGGARARVRRGAGRPARRTSPRSSISSPPSSSALADPARGIAAHARRHRRDGRAAQLAHRGRGADRGGCVRRLGRRALRDRHRWRAHARDAAGARDQRGAAQDGYAGARAGRVPVLGGFVGATMDGHTTTLGRGGSDYSGALVGAGIGAREIQIWTDVDGMLTRGPARHRRRRGSSRSCRSPRPPSSPISAPRCCTRARSCRPSSATSRSASSTRGSPTAAGTLITAGAAACTARVSPGWPPSGTSGRGHHVHAHADGLWLSPPRVRGVRALLARPWTW